MARLVVPGFPHHVTQRGNRRQKTFFNESDYRIYRRLISESCARTGTEVWAYCLMPNHVHLVMVPVSVDGLREALAEGHRRYTLRVNTREGWRGHLWQERFHSFPMDERHLLAAVRYVELNPVAAGLCGRAEQWPWSSARAHLSGRDDGLVTVAPMLERISDWNGYINSDVDTDAAELMRQHTRTGRPLGGLRFLEELERLTGRRLQRQKPGPKPGKRCQVHFSDQLFSRK
jgi:putative transposase